MRSAQPLCDVCGMVGWHSVCLDRTGDGSSYSPCDGLAAGVIAASLLSFDRLVFQAALIVRLVPLTVAAKALAIPRLSSTGAALTTLGMTRSCVLVALGMPYRPTCVAVPLGTPLLSAVLSAGDFFLAQHSMLSGAWVLLQSVALAVL